jgi:hypothetical protein
MPEYDIEMLWRCHRCSEHRINRGLARHCGGCGGPKSEEDEELFPNDISIRAALHGRQEQLAAAGEDFKCKYCGSNQSALNAFCDECGADQKSAATAWKAPDKTATLDVDTGAREDFTAGAREPVPPVTTPSLPDDTPQPVAARSSTAPHVVFGASGQAPFRQMTGRALRPSSKRPRGWFWPTTLGLAAVLFVGVGLWWLLHPRFENAVVSGLHWERHVDIERYQRWPREGWDPPLDGIDIIDEGARLHHTRFHVLVGSHRERVTDTASCGCTKVSGRCHGKTKVVCKSNKNGTAHCTGGDPICDPDTCEAKTCMANVNDYRDIRVYQEWYGWSEWGWGYNRTVVHEGADGPPLWPTDDEMVSTSVGPGESERPRGRGEHYEVTFRGASDSYTFSPATEDEFLQYKRGTRWRLKRNAFGVTEVLPL